MLGFIGQIVSAIFEEFRPYYEDIVHYQDPKTKLKNQLRVLYGRGVISRERFLDLLNRLQWDQIGQGDVQLLYQEARLSRRSTAVRPASRELARGMEQLYLDRGIAEELREEIEECRSVLVQEAAWIEEQVKAAQQGANAALPEEAEARAYLEVWQELLSLSHTFEAQLHAQAEDLRRLDLLEAELRVHISEMKILEARERFAGLKLRIIQDLLPQSSQRARR